MTITVIMILTKMTKDIKKNITNDEIKKKKVNMKLIFHKILTLAPSSLCYIFILKFKAFAYLCI